MRIGEVAELTGLTISNIRFYEKKGLIEPAREQDSKYRDYKEEDINRIKEIVLYRKMDLSLETISAIIMGDISLNQVLDQQIQTLTEKQEMLQGSIDLCKKIQLDWSIEKQGTDYYLNYVKEEEANGIRFGNAQEFIEDLATVTSYDRILGLPMYLWLLSHPTLNRILMILWGIFWIGAPILGIADAIWDDDVNAKLFVFWGVWILLFTITFISYRKEKEVGLETKGSDQNPSQQIVPK